MTLLKKFKRGKKNHNQSPKVVRFAKKGQLRKLRGALDSGCSVNSVDNKKRSALFLAALKGHKSCLKELLKRGANPNQKNENGQTPCHAAALGGTTPFFPTDTCSTRNPVKGTFYCGKGLYDSLSHYLYHSKLQRRCLEYLVMYGGDLRVKSIDRETTRDVAVRRRQMAIVSMIEEYFELQATASGYNISKGQSMLRPTDTYPAACPAWMHHTAVDGSASFEAISPAPSQTTSSFYRHRCSEVYEYGFMFPYDRRTTPGSVGGVPEILPLEVTKAKEIHHVGCVDGSVWCKANWGGGSVPVTLRQLGQDKEDRRIMTVALLLKEMKNLSTLRHPNIVLLMAVCCGPSKADMFLTLEPLHPASLHHQLHVKNKTFSPHEAASIIWDITSAVAYLHTVKFVTHNIISSHAVYLTAKHRAKLCNVYCCQEPDTKLPGKLSSALRLFLPWMAPELMKTRLTSYENDVYSIGVLLWEVWGGDRPWPGLSPPQLGRVLVDEGQRLPITKKHERVSSILRGCFGPPHGRLSMKQLLSQLEFLKKHSMSTLYNIYSHIRIPKNVK